MAYSTKVLDHFENPRNVGSFPPIVAAEDIGTGMVGAPACGDVMKLQIQVDLETGLIIDAKFKTYGCLVSNTLVNTPTKSKKISKLRAGDKVLAWNGEHIVSNSIEQIITHLVDVNDLLRVTFQPDYSSRNGVQPLPSTLICTREHIFWLANNKPIEAQNLAPGGDELFEITEFELRKITNVRHQEGFRTKSALRMKIFNEQFDHSSLPQNQPGFTFSTARDAKLSASSKQKWTEKEYVDKWCAGMAAIDRSAPTLIEKTFTNFFLENDIPVRYSAGKIWIQTKFGPRSPDFIVPGKRKVIEVYSKNMPEFMEDRSHDSGYVQRKKKEYASIGYEVLCLAIEDGFDLPTIQQFTHNGLRVVAVEKITHGNQLRGVERENKKVKVYDLKLSEGAHVFFTSRAANHNCGSAIASSSLVTEWVKGKTLDQAGSIKNSQIAEELALPPVKIHCSILAEDAIKAAIADYKKKR